MEIIGTRFIEADRQKVWDALNNPVVLQICIPGCKSLEKKSNREMLTTVETKIGPVEAVFKGSFRLENLNPPESYTILGEGKGGSAGFAKGGADVKLTEVEGGTRLDYEARVAPGGRIAELGEPLVDSTAKKLANAFFDNFSDCVGKE